MNGQEIINGKAVKEYRVYLTRPCGYGKKGDVLIGVFASRDEAEKVYGMMDVQYLARGNEFSGIRFRPIFEGEEVA